MNYSIHFLDKQSEFDKVMQDLAGAAWIGFDTEFVGEKTYIPHLCLIQVVAEGHIYLLDTLKINDLSSFLNIVEDEKVLKITHAGDNDYRLLNTLFGSVPKNTFDTQIAAGFIGYNYPAGFGKIVEKELRVNLAKSHTVADWEARPLDPKAIDYAVEDVKYLPVLYEKLTIKLQKHKRESWSREENLKWEQAEFYVPVPNKELLSNDYVYQVNLREKIFLKRLYQWRIERATQLNLPKEQVLQARHIPTVARAIKDGPNAFRSNRTLHENAWKRNLEAWQTLWKTPHSAEEIEYFDKLPKPLPENPDREWTMELLYHFVKKKCMEHEISAALLFPKGDFNRLKSGSEDFDSQLLQGWRAELIGQDLVHWLLKGNNIKLAWENGHCKLTM
jgi:ribonuclease D